MWCCHQSKNSYYRLTMKIKLKILFSEITNFQLPLWPLCRGQFEKGWGGTSSFNARNYWSVLVIIVISLVFIEKWNRRFFSFSLYFLFIFSRKWKTINEIWNPEKICQYGEGNILHIFLRNLYIYIYNFSWQHKT